jgi:hypothetical protein
LCLCLLLLDCSIVAITNGQSRAVSQTCTLDNALGLIEQQIAATKSFDNSVQRIAVLLRAADLLWPYRRERARASFAEAFDLASQYRKENGEETRTDGKLLVKVTDQRIIVITAIAKRDAEWARKLSRQIVEDDEKDVEDGKAKQTAQIGEKLLAAASSLLATDEVTALGFARSSLSYPATIQLPVFLYKLAAADKSAADKFYQEALGAYAHAPMDQFLYLSSYPFASDREVGEMPVWTYYAVPAGLTPNQNLQRLFVQTLLTGAQVLLQMPANLPRDRFSEASQVWMALTRLEPQVAISLSDLSPQLQELKGQIFAILSEENQQHVTETLNPPLKKSFEDLIETADKIAGGDRRESAIAMAILNASSTESLENIEAAGNKVEDLSLRSQLLSHVYFNRTQRAIKEKRIEEARRLAAKVDDLDLRAYLYSLIAIESIKQTKNDVQAREILESVLDVLPKAPNTDVKARALLAVAYLYSNIDPNRAVAVLSDSVETINHIESVDLSHDYVQKRIEGKAFGSYTTIQTPGFSLETVFREIAKVDFDGVLYLVGRLTNKPLRAQTLLALAEPCLKNQPVDSKPKQQGSRQ